MLQKQLLKILDVNVDNIVSSKLVKTETNSKYLIGYLDKFIRPLDQSLKSVDMLRDLKLKWRYR